MWEQLMQMLQAIPQGGGMTGGPMMGGGAIPTGPFPSAPAPTGISDMASRISLGAKAIEKGISGMPGTPKPPQVATPPAPTPSPYRPNMGGGTPGVGSAEGGDVMQMLMGMPGIQQMLGAGAGGGIPDQMGNMNKAPGAGVPPLGQLMMMMQQRQM